MFNRNGYVMRLAYPEGFKGDSVDICPTLRLFAAAFWKETSFGKKLSSAGWFVASVFAFVILHALLAISAVFLSAFWLFANGSLKWLGKSDSESFPLREYRIPYLYEFRGVRILPAFWISMLMLVLGLALLIPFFFFIALPYPRGDAWIVMLIFTVVWPTMIWGKLCYSYNRKRFGKMLAECAPLLARELSFPRTKRALSDTKEVLALLGASVGGFVKRTCFTVKVTD